MVAPQIVYLDGSYRFNLPRNIMAPSVSVPSGERVSFRVETGAAGSHVILEHSHEGTPYECRLSFDDQREADEWIEKRIKPTSLSRFGR